MNVVAFEAKVNRTESCWLWTGSLDTSGYGLFRVDGSLQKAHRVAVRLDGRSIAAGQIVLHTCDTPACVNPAHLVVGTSLENARDRDQKGHWRRGRGNQKLTHQIAEEIRSRFAAGENRPRLAQEYDISLPHLYKVGKGFTTYV